MNFNFFLLWVFLLILCLKIQPSPCPPVVFFCVIFWFSLPIRSVTVPGRRVGSRSLPCLSSLWRSMWVSGCSKLFVDKIAHCLPNHLYSSARDQVVMCLGDSISVWCVVLNEFLVSFSENGIWIANLGLALGPLTVLWEGNRHAGSFLLCLLSLAPESTLYLSPQARCDQGCLSRWHNTSVRMTDICLDKSSGYASSDCCEILTHFSLMAGSTFLFCPVCNMNINTWWFYHQ